MPLWAVAWMGLSLVHFSRVFIPQLYIYFLTIKQSLYVVVWTLLTTHPP